MKFFKRFLKILGICFAILLGIIAIIVIIVAIQGGFSGNKIDVASISFAQQGNQTLVTDHTLDDYIATVYFTPNNATEKHIKLSLNKDGQQVVEIPNEVIAGEPFVIKVKKREIYLNKQTYSLNVGGEAEITATDSSNMFSCRLRLVVDVELPETGLKIVSQNEYHEEDGGYYVINRLSNGELTLNVQTQPVNALYPNTNQIGAEDLGYRQVYLNENNSYSIVSVTPKESFYHEPTNTYFDYDIYKNEVKTDANGGLYLYINGQMYTNLVRLRHLSYVLRISNDIGSTFNIIAKTFATYDMQQDYLQFERDVEDLEQDKKFPFLAAYLNKYKDIISKHTAKKYFNTELGSATVKEENAEEFLERITNSVTGIIEINDYNNYESALKYIYVEDSINFRVNEVQASAIGHTRSNIELDLYSDTYQDSKIYNISNMSKQDLIELFGISIRDQNNNLVDNWIGDVEVYSIKVDDIKPYENDKQNYFNLFKSNGELKSEYNNNDVILVNTNEDGFTQIKAVNPEAGSHSYLHIRIVRNPSAINYEDKYLSFNVKVGVKYALADNISIQNIKELYTNTDLEAYPHIQELIIGDGTQLDANVRVTATNANYTKVVVVAKQDNLFLPTGQPKIRLGERVMLTAFVNAQLQQAVPEYAYMLPVNAQGNYYIEALNNTGADQVELMAMIVKTDQDGNIIYDRDNNMVVTNNSLSATLTISTIAEHIYFYSIDGDKYYKRNVGDSTITTNTLNMFVGGTYKIYISVFDIDINGRIVMPQTDPDINYIYNMLYAYNNMLNNLSNIKVIDTNSNEKADVVNFSQYFGNTSLDHDNIQNLMTDASYVNTPIDAINYYNQNNPSISASSDLINQILDFIAKTYDVARPYNITITDIIPSLKIDDQAEVIDFVTQYYDIQTDDSANWFPFMEYSELVSNIRERVGSLLHIKPSNQSGEDSFVIELLSKDISLYHLQQTFTPRSTKTNYNTQYDQVLEEVRQAIINQADGQFDIINQVDDISSVLSVANLLNVMKVVGINQQGILQKNADDNIYIYNQCLQQLINYITSLDGYRNLAVNQTSSIDEVIDALIKNGVDITNLSMPNNKNAIIDYVRNLQFNAMLKNLNVDYENLDLMSLMTHSGYTLNTKQLIQDYFNVTIEENVQQSDLNKLFILKTLNDNGYRLSYNTTMQAVAKIINDDFTKASTINNLDELIAVSDIDLINTNETDEAKQKEEILTKLGLDKDADINEFMLQYYLGIAGDNVIEEANDKVRAYAAKLKQITNSLDMTNVDVKLNNTDQVLSDAIVKYNIKKFNEYFSTSLNSVEEIISHLKDINLAYYTYMLDDFASNRNIFTILKLLNENGAEISYLPQDATLNDLYTALGLSAQAEASQDFYTFKTVNREIKGGDELNFFRLIDGIDLHEGDTISIDSNIGVFYDKQNGQSTFTLTPDQINYKTLTIYFKDTFTQNSSQGFTFTVTFGASSLINILNSIEGSNTLTYLINTNLMREFYYVYNFGKEITANNHVLITKPVLQDILDYVNNQTAQDVYGTDYLNTLHSTHSQDKTSLFVSIDITARTVIEQYGTRYVCIPQYSTDWLAIMINDLPNIEVSATYNDEQIGGLTNSDDVEAHKLTFTQTEGSWSEASATINLTVDLSKIFTQNLRDPRFDPTVDDKVKVVINSTIATINFDESANTITVTPNEIGAETTIDIIIGNTVVWQIRVVCTQPASGE